MVEIPDEPTEGDTKRGGFLSYSAEWHALAIGLAVGITAGLTSNWELLAIVVGVSLGIRAAPTGPLEELRREPAYVLGGIVIGLVFLACSVGF